jgi:tRNA dimethylallyltransferase
VKHFFIDNKSIEELYGAGHFEKDAIKLLEDLFKSHTIVFVVGGSGLYIDALLKGVDDFEEVPSEIRNKLNAEYSEKGLAWLQEKVKEVDPAYYNSVDIHNPQRLIRALEVYEFTGKPYSGFLSKPKVKRHFTPIKILINLERKELYERIDKRVDDMMAAGLLKEVKQLTKYRNHNALKTVGYKELYEFIDGKMKLEEAVEKIKQHTRNYAKRQITWFKNRDVFEEFGPEDRDKIITYIDSFLKHG